MNTIEKPAGANKESILFIIKNWVLPPIIILMLLLLLHYSYKTSYFLPIVVILYTLAILDAFLTKIYHQPEETNKNYQTLSFYYSLLTISLIIYLISTNNTKTIFIFYLLPLIYFIVYYLRIIIFNIKNKQYKNMILITFIVIANSINFVSIFNHNPPLKYYITDNNRDVVSFLLIFNSSKSWYKHDNPLSYATTPEMIDLLTAKGFNVNDCSIDGYPLELAIKHNRKDLVIKLLEKGALLIIKDDPEKPDMIEYSIYSSNLEIFKILINKERNFDEYHMKTYLSELNDMYINGQKSSVEKAKALINFIPAKARKSKIKSYISRELISREFAETIYK